MGMSIMNAVLIDIDQPSRTGKGYSLSVCRDIMKHDVLYGELDPSSLYLDVNKTSHHITNMQIVNNKLIGDVLVLDTDMGKVLEQVIDECVLVPRGTGHVDDKKHVSNYNIIAFDYISKQC